MEYETKKMLPYYVLPLHYAGYSIITPDTELLPVHPLHCAPCVPPGPAQTAPHCSLRSSSYPSCSPEDRRSISGQT